MGHRELRRTADVKRKPRFLIGLLLSLAMPAVNATGIGDLLSRPADDARILAVDDAFHPQPAIWQKGRLLVGVDVAPGCYLYRDRFSVEALEPDGYALGAASLPTGEAHRDEHFGEVRILRGRLTASYKPVAHDPPKRVRIRYQGCADGLVCYPPQTRVLSVESVR